MLKNERNAQKSYAVMMHVVALGLAFALGALIITSSGPSHAQSLSLPGTEEPSGATDQKAPVDAFGRSTPRGTIQGYLAAVAEEDYERAAEYLDQVDGSQSTLGENRVDLARDLQVLLDRGGWIVATWQLANAPEGLPRDGLPADIDVFGYAPTSEEPHPLTVSRRDSPDGAPIWLIDNQTLDVLPSLLSAADVSVVDDVIPPSLKQSTFWGVSFGHWLALVLVAVLALAVASVNVGAKSGQWGGVKAGHLADKGAT